jgi:hypothetical protein
MDKSEIKIPHFKSHYPLQMNHLFTGHLQLVYFTPLILLNISHTKDYLTQEEIRM